MTTHCAAALPMFSGHFTSASLCFKACNCFIFAVRTLCTCVSVCARTLCICVANFVSEHCTCVTVCLDIVHLCHFVCQDIVQMYQIHVNIVHLSEFILKDIKHLPDCVCVWTSLTSICMGQGIVYQSDCDIVHMSG